MHILSKTSLFAYLISSLLGIFELLLYLVIAQSIHNYFFNSYTIFLIMALSGVTGFTVIRSVRAIHVKKGFKEETGIGSHSHLNNIFYIFIF